MGYSEGQYVLGIEGLALLRAGAEGRFERARELTGELSAVVSRLDDSPYAERRDLPVHGIAGGYAGWAATYDDPGNDLIELEEPLVRDLLDRLPDGVVLDAACGTGRHAEYLAERGRRVVGVDSSPEMLRRAREKLPRADLREGDLTRLPLDDASVSGAVCALALSHLPQLGPAIGELGRVLAPGGRLVISNPHPLATGLLGWRAVFVDSRGVRSSIPEHAHLHSAYLDAFAAAGLVARRCIEPGLSAGQARARAKAGHEVAFEQALTGLPVVIVWEAERAP